MRTAAARALVLVFVALISAGCGTGEKDGGAVVIFESTPEDGATVVIGGRTYGETPVTIRGLPAGQYYAILNQYGYKRHTKAFTLQESGDVKVTVDMLPLVGYLSLDSRPRHAMVYIDGLRYIGDTPLIKVPLPLGEHTYELRLENHLTTERKLSVREDYQYSFTHLLRPMKARVQVFSRPSGAQIYINDQLQRSVTPHRLQLVPGTYTIGAYNKGYVMAEKVVEATPNGNHIVDLRLVEGEVPPGMVLIPAGEFIFGVDGGAPDELPERRIDLDAFYIDKFEVTNSEFAEVFPGHKFAARTVNYPVRAVSWTQATKYAISVGKRLPTEQEWEKAARGTDGRDYPWGNTFDAALCNLGQSINKVRPIGQYRGGASPYGVMDMSGNVLEWTSDWYQPYPGNEAITIDYGQVFRVLRGGSFLSDAFDVRCSRRHYDAVENNRSDYGFRCAMDVADDAGPS